MNGSNLVAVKGGQRSLQSPRPRGGGGGGGPYSKFQKRGVGTVSSLFKTPVPPCLSAWFAGQVHALTLSAAQAFQGQWAGKRMTHKDLDHLNVF